MTRDEILNRAEKYGSMIAGWCFNAQGLEKFWREAYEMGQQSERKVLNQEIVRLTRVGSVSQYVQGRWDLASELQEILKARGGE